MQTHKTEPNGALSNSATISSVPPFRLDIIPIDSRSHLEVADKRHRYAKNLRLYFKEYTRLFGAPGGIAETDVTANRQTTASTSSSAIGTSNTSATSQFSRYEPFFQWLDGISSCPSPKSSKGKEGEESDCIPPSSIEATRGSCSSNSNDISSSPLPELPECPRSVLDNDRVQYLSTEAERNPYHICIGVEDGLWRLHRSACGGCTSSSSSSSPPRPTTATTAKQHHHLHHHQHHHHHHPQSHQEQLKGQAHSMKEHETPSSSSTTTSTSSSSSSSSSILVNTGPKGWIFVLMDGTLYAAEKKTQGNVSLGQMRFHHSSFFAGAGVHAAGMLVCEDGRLVKLFPHSGHYRPHDRHLFLLLEFLRTQGIDLSKVQVDVQRIMKQARPSEKDGSKVKKTECSLYSDGNTAYYYLRAKQSALSGGLLRQINEVYFKHALMDNPSPASIMQQQQQEEQQRTEIGVEEGRVAEEWSDLNRSTSSASITSPFASPVLQPDFRVTTSAIPTQKPQKPELVQPSPQRHICSAPVVIDEPAAIPHTNQNKDDDKQNNSRDISGCGGDGSCISITSKQSNSQCSTRTSSPTGPKDPPTPAMNDSSDYATSKQRNEPLRFSTANDGHDDDGEASQTLNLSTYCSSTLRAISSESAIATTVGKTPGLGSSPSLTTPSEKGDSGTSVKPTGLFVTTATEAATPHSIASASAVTPTSSSSTKVSSSSSLKPSPRGRKRPVKGNLRQLIQNQQQQQQIDGRESTSNTVDFPEQRDVLMGNRARNDNDNDKIIIADGVSVSEGPEGTFLVAPSSPVYSTGSAGSLSTSSCMSSAAHSLASSGIPTALSYGSLTALHNMGIHMQAAVGATVPVPTKTATATSFASSPPPLSSISASNHFGRASANSLEATKSKVEDTTLARSINSLQIEGEYAKDIDDEADDLIFGDIDVSAVPTTTS
mmetsp:Transcript_23412/g.39009  ORF Transcript_23412/g.39009 Transcript_23412/m.39009 type:complete len:941 (+) Transcript_23412:88-2910(+)